jgi:esterase/lipase superfamily enzyme
MQRSYEKWTSPSLGRPMEFLWYGWSGYPVVMFPTSMGRFFQYEDSGLVRGLAAKIEAGQLQVICADSYDAESWYDEFVPPYERGKRHERYDRYLTDELFPYVRARAKRPDAGVFGCSFGAYHAANVAGRHPDMVTKAVCLSGVFDVHRFLDGYWDLTAYYNSPVAYIANMDESWLARLRRIDWILATGEYDFLAEDNRRFDEVLSQRGIPHYTEIWHGIYGHDWPSWNEAAARLL